MYSGNKSNFRKESQIEVQCGRMRRLGRLHPNCGQLVQFAECQISRFMIALYYVFIFDVRAETCTVRWYMSKLPVQMCVICYEQMTMKITNW